jgi:hypothetical protein
MLDRLWLTHGRRRAAMSLVVPLVQALVEEWRKQRANAPHPETAVWLPLE